MINVFSRDEIIEYGYRPDEYYISILPTGGPQGAPIFEQAPNVLTLIFDDVEEDCVKTKLPHSYGLRYAKAFTIEQAKQTAAFLKGLPNKFVLNIHCVHGVSRSAAMAAAINNSKNTEAGNKRVYKLMTEQLYGIS